MKETDEEIRSETSHLTRGAWIEILCAGSSGYDIRMSHLTRGAWIEISNISAVCTVVTDVAPHTRCVD